MREITIGWTTPSGAHLTVLNFDDAVAVAAQRAALGAALADMSEQISNQVNAVVATEGREFDVATGAGTGFWAEPTPYDVDGLVTQQPVADATQVLLRWRTEIVRNGRRIQGRTFIPGLITTSVTSGNLGTTAQALFSGVAQALVDADVGLEIFSRPLPEQAGVAAPVTTGSAWSELAVLRRRRG